MLRLNLLPWRERQRQAAQRRLGLTLVGSLVLALCAVLLMDQLARQRVQRQALANDARQILIDAAARQVTQHEQISQAHQAVMAQIAALEGLRADRPLLTALFGDVERALPEGVQLVALKIQGADLRIAGVAASTAVVAQFMRDLERSSVLRELELKQVRSLPGGDEFLLTARLSGAWS
ncbi:PilN domain-containing protein [Pseudomonas sp. NPDC089401]|uniref:PilN domain-containing protein n=1 Tax=Pseudomonas sp. NPDC089401 TaxID=3364462 RepID=UPI00380AA047